MDTTTIDQEFAKLQADFQDVAKTVEGMAAKMKAANETEWLDDLKQVAQDIDDEQTQVKALLLAVHDFIGGVAQTQQEKPPLYAPGQEPAAADEASQQPQHHGLLGGGMMGGGMFGGYYGGGFGRAMEMGMAMNLGANLVGNIFRI
jgi:hypothetical protein